MKESRKSREKRENWRIEKRRSGQEIIDRSSTRAQQESWPSGFRSVSPFQSYQIYGLVKTLFIFEAVVASDYMYFH
ncbi:hypothetical protein AFLA_010360 [Aspergillus flavus NRRL3357]|nr:hypothetical protein AFLA_010360 [Aspergillus flavus NRRL3357]